MKTTEKLYSYLMLLEAGYTPEEAEAIVVEARKKLQAEREENK
ncbi:hypothetical protein P59_180 [Bacillus phage P59]|nr:hypothetical protein P59_180 [Bacillus phage P59]